MTKSPKVVESGKLAAEAYRLLQDNKIDEIPVVDKKYRPIGLVDVHDILREGLV